MKIRYRTLVLLLIISVIFASSFFILQQEREKDGHWPWPLNGELVNHSKVGVIVWDDDHGSYSIAANSRSSQAFDIDHAYEAPTRRWCKLGAHTLIVQTNGLFANCQCYALNKGRPCIKF